MVDVTCLKILGCQVSCTRGKIQTSGYICPDKTNFNFDQCIGLSDKATLTYPKVSPVIYLDAAGDEDDTTARC